MKKIIVLLICLALGIQGYSQEYKRNGKEFSTVKQEKTKSSETKTGYTWKDSDGNVYDIYISSRGSCYIYRTSRKTGKLYKYYLPKEVSAEIAEELEMSNQIDYN